MQKISRIYARESMRKGVRDISTARQIERGLERAAERGERPVIYEEPVGHNSGRNENRRKWKELWRDCEREPEETGSVIVCNLARFSRADNVMELLRRLKRDDIDFIDLDEEFDIATYEGRRIARAKIVQNSQYADDISQWTSKAAKKHREKGWYWGKPPLGLKTELNEDGQGKHLAPSNETYLTDTGETRTYLDTVTEYCRLRSTYRISRPEAMRRLRAAGFKYRGKFGKIGHGAPVPITPEHLEHLDSRLSYYAGFIENELLRGAIAVAHDRGQHQMNGNAPTGETFLCAQILYCLDCNQRLRQASPFSGRYRYYRHRLRHEDQFAKTWCAREKNFSAQSIDAQVLGVLHWVHELTPEQKLAAAEQIARSPQEDRATLDLLLKREALQTRISGLILLMADEDMDPEDVKPLLQSAKNDLKNLPQPETMPRVRSQMNVEDALQLLENVGEIVTRAATLDGKLVNTLLHTLFRKLVINREGTIVCYNLQPELADWFPMPDYAAETVK